MIQAQRRAGGFCEEVKPFVNLRRILSVTPAKSKHDFLHEREWRLRKDLNLRKVEPFAVIVEDYDTGTEGWEDMWRARIAYEEIGEGPSE